MDEKITKTIGNRLAEMEEGKEVFALILDVLEGGDRAIDFDDPTIATTIRIIAQIAGNALMGLTLIKS